MRELAKGSTAVRVAIEHPVGFTRMQQVANAAYHSSVDAAFSTKDGATVLRQAARMLPRNLELAKRVDDVGGPRLARLRELNSQPGTAALFRDPKARCEDAAFGAAMRFRLGAPLRNTPTEVECPGCHAVFSAREFLFHAGACARVPGANISTSHASVKKAFAQLCHVTRVTCESAEPRDLRRTVCPGCKAELVEATWSTHAKACKLFNELTMAPPRGSGPDIRFYPPGKPGADSQFDATVMDVTHVALMTASHPGAPAAEFKKRKDAKEAKYGPACAESNTRLVVGATSENGVLSRDFGRQIDEVALNAGMPSYEARKLIQAAVQVGQGRSIANAERRAGLAYLPRTAAAAVSVVTRAHNPDGADAAAAPWLHAAAPASPSATPTSPPILPQTPVSIPAPRAAAPAVAPPAAPSSSSSSAAAAVAAPSSAGDGALPVRESSPEPSAPAPRTHMLRFGKSPIAPHEDNVYTGDMLQLRPRATQFMMQFPGVGAIINLMRQRHAGHYVSWPLLRATAGPGVDLPANALVNARAICAAFNLVTERGIILCGESAIARDDSPARPSAAATSADDASSAPASGVAGNSNSSAALAPIQQNIKPSRNGTTSSQQNAVADAAMAALADFEE